MLDDFHRLGRRQFYHLPPQGKLRVLQRVTAVGALLDLVLYRLGRGLPTSSTVLVCGSLAARLLLGFIFGLRCVGFDEGGWLRLTLVFVQFFPQLSNHSQCFGKLPLESRYLST